MSEILLTIILVFQLFIFHKLELLMTKQDFLQAIGDFKTEIGVVSGKVDALETLINGASTDVDPAIVAAFQDLKTSMDSLNTKADNAPAPDASAPTV